MPPLQFLIRQMYISIPAARINEHTVDATKGRHLMSLESVVLPYIEILTKIH